MKKIFADLAIVFTEPIAKEIEEVTTSSHFRGVISKNLVDKITAATKLKYHDIQLSLLPLAASFARPPISNFYVGVVAEGFSGNLYFGINVEFPDNQLAVGVHGEQSAMINAFMHGEDGLRTFAVNAPPCGMCRQFLRELADVDNIKVILPKAQEPTKLKYYLPQSFGPRELGVEAGLMRKEDHGLTITEHDSLTKMALTAANKSYAPYTKAYSGFALQTKNGSTYSGAYVENAAFHPSVSPATNAFVQMAFAGERWENIQRAILVEKANAPITQAYITRNILQAIAPMVELIVIKAD